MKIKLNGKEVLIKDNINIENLLKLKQINKKNIVIEINKVIITKDLWSKNKLNENDEVEIITAVGGG
tara:strand:+ start:67 stop:267 length:201 start_codon:yes stop_codon:yes gene_type:complete